ncbi:MAG: membrane dipeptidase [Bacillota bacterium]|nr:membrane dipeptidase [Bacillota bacterium]
MSMTTFGSLGEPGSLSLRIDGHCDTITALKNGKASHIDLDAMEYYVDAQFFALYIKEESATAEAVRENMSYYRYYRDILLKNKKIVPILKGSDLKDLKPGQVGSILAIENAEALAVSGDALYEFIDMGYRSFGITWSNENSFAGGANTEVGLKDLGRDLLRAMNDQPVVVDLAHMSRQSFFDSLEVLEKAPVVTHSCCYGLCKHCRNLEDDALISLASVGGIMGITFVRRFLQEDDLATIDRIVDHIIYAADIMGIDKVAIGSDFDGADLPVDMDSQRDMDKLWQQMAQRDFMPEEIAAVRGGNWQRFLSEALGDNNEI